MQPLTYEQAVRRAETNFENMTDAQRLEGLQTFLDTKLGPDWEEAFFEFWVDWQANLMLCDE